MTLKLTILGIPQPKQSVRSSGKVSKFGNIEIRHYQPYKVKQIELILITDSRKVI